MADVSIDRSSFPSEGGSFTISLSKTDALPWGAVTIASASWYTIGEMTDVSPFLYTIDVVVDANTSGTTRTMGVSVTVDGLSELFTISQPSQNALSADIVSVSPAGNVAASGGQITVDIYANGGDDSLTAGVVTTGTGITLTSTTHGVSSGGYTCTRCVFTWVANTGTSARSCTLTFTVDDNNGNTATATVTKSQNGVVIQQGTLSASNMTAAATDTSAATAVTAVDMDNSTLTATTTAAWVTSAQVTSVGGILTLQLVITANTGASARTATLTLSGTDIYGNSITASCTLTQDGTTPPTHKINAYWYAPDTGVLGYQGGTQNMRIQYTGTFTGNETVTINSSWPGLSKTRNSYVNYDISYAGGNIATQQIVPIEVSRVGDDGVTYTFTLNLRLTPGGVFPIWEDVFGAIISDDDWEDYELQENGSLLYAGRAFKYPDEGDIEVNISRVVAPYLTGYYKDVDFISDGNTLGSYTFVRDYSYDRSMDYTQNLVLNAPINGKTLPGVAMSASMWSPAGSGSLQVTDEGGSLVVNETLTKGLNTGDWISGSAGKSYTIGSEVYTVVDACRGALLKYVNAYGAFDFFLVDGVSKKADKITRASYEKDAAAMTMDFETRDYQASMEAGWTGTTGWLTDAQSARMKHLVESVEVYMIDVSSGEEIPVVMRDSSLAYKTYDNNGRKLVNYTLTWTESQKKIRR